MKNKFKPIRSNNINIDKAAIKNVFKIFLN